ncbi:regulator of G-protein signaling 9-binding protein-like [Gouania willdenowi]|uniref:Regulator of G-protein signaling 9-binding protein-like n=1 Tax=Gouania willdenowi TaxID=441366 RepID=A0A8C5ENV4_GOUWI|nr:regulator of G-protein signaling 9-binding protein-like [Gouania willdenowi]XP_028301732.1 regulator of G-protein signaling 9-binding protein-like [Gouania willdenowi]
MSLWRWSVDELALQRLSYITSCFHHMVACVGSSADGHFLREQMEESRRRAERVVSALSQRLLCQLSGSTPSMLKDRKSSERLWVNFLSAVENFLSDMRKASHLIGWFPLTDRRTLVNTGAVDGLVVLEASPQESWISLEEEPNLDLNTQICRTEQLLSELQLRVPVFLWAVECGNPAWFESGTELDTPDDSLEDLMEVVTHSNKVSSCCCIRASK